MKILHTADWHLGKKLHNHDRIEEQKDVLNEIQNIAIQEDVDLILIAGDIFDSSNPSIEATDLLYATLKKLTRNATVPVVAIAGNHDSADRINMPNALARECGIILIGYPHQCYSPLTHDNWSITESGPGWIDITFQELKETVHITTTAFTNEIRLRSFISDNNDEEKGLINYLSQHWQFINSLHLNKEKFKILMAHQLIWPDGTQTIPIEDEGEKSILVGNTSIIPSHIIPTEYHYVALGHLHKYQKIKGPTSIYYSGSPIAYSFSEANQEKYIQVITTKKDQLENVEKIKLISGKKLITNTFSDLYEAKEFISNYRDHHLEITIEVDEYISAQQSKDLRDATDNHLSIIPVIKNKNEDPNNTTFDIKKMANITDTFKQFFKEEKGIEPSAEIIDLFKEIIQNQNED